MITKFLALYLLLISSSNLFALSESDTKSFLDANAFYDKGDYAGAITKYHELTSRHGKSGELYFNLANAHYKNGELGKSIFYYIKAQKILPRNGDVKYNLEYAKNQKVDKQESSKDLFDLFNIPLNHDELLILTTLLALFFWIILIITLYKKNFIIIFTRTLALTFFVLASGLLIFSHVSKKEWGIIIAEESSVFSTIGADSIKLFTLHEGSEATILSKKDNWILITLGDNRKGWIPSDKLIY